MHSRDQKTLTEIAWDCIKSANIAGGMDINVYNNMIGAYTFQELPLSVTGVVEEIKVGC